MRSMKTLKATLGRDLCLQLDHSFLVARRVWRFTLEAPGKELVRIVGLEVRVENTETLAVLCNLLLSSVSGGSSSPSSIRTYPVTLDVLQIFRKVSVGALEDLPIQSGSHHGLHVDVIGQGFLRLGKHVVGSLLACSHKFGHFVGIFGYELVVTYRSCE